MKWELKQIDLTSLAKVVLFLYAILGFVIGIPIGFIIYLGSYLPGMEENPIPRGLAFLFPFITMFAAAITQTIVALLGGLFYNLIARLLGGVEVELKELSSGTVPPSGAMGAVDLSAR